ncbi:MAG: tetratricopeptide repeat protein [Planctomycetes bacterium]|nr:tetratricopeptide repeat protein [Planctomycetota bacterium]
MKSLLNTSVLLLVAGCSLPPSGALRIGDRGGVEVRTDAGPIDADRAAPSASVAVVESNQDPKPATRSQDPSGIDIWNDPKFQNYFIESYLPDTEVEPPLAADERTTLQEIMGAIAKNDLDFAQSQLESIVSTGNSSPMFEFTLGNVHFQRDEFESAAKAYQQALDRFPKFRRAWKNLGICYVRQSDFANAVRSFGRVVENGGSDAIVYGLLGYSSAKTGDAIAAESAYRMAALFDPDLVDYKRGLAQSLFEQQRFPEVAALLGSMIERNSHDGKLWLLQANAFLAMKQSTKAAENYEIVDHLGQSTAASLNTLGDIYVNDELFDLALSAYERAFAKTDDPSPSQTLRNAKVLVSRNAMPQAKQLLNTVESQFGAVLGDEDRKDILKARAKIAMSERSSDDQAAILEEIVKLDPLDGEALILLGQHYASKGEGERAILYYENAAAIPEFEADAKLRHAQLLVREGKYAGAIPLLRRAQVLKPRDYVQDWLEKVERYAQGGQ